MINKRLTWFLESNNHIWRFQSGFRSDCSTTDNLVRLETFIRDAFIKKEHVVAVFLFAAFEAANFQIDFFGNPVMRTAQ